MTCPCGHAWSHHYDEGCCHHTVGRICPCTKQPPHLTHPPDQEDNVPTSPPQICIHCGHSNLAHTTFGNCLACVPGREGHDCRAVLVHEFVHAARTKYERLEVELGSALDELELLKKRYSVLEGKLEKTKWHIERAAGRLEEALEEINWVPKAQETTLGGEE